MQKEFEMMFPKELHSFKATLAGVITGVTDEM